jgi:hypothetical protein
LPVKSIYSYLLEILPKKRENIRRMFVVILLTQIILEMGLSGTKKRLKARPFYNDTKSLNTGDGNGESRGS